MTAPSVTEYSEYKCRPESLEDNGNIHRYRIRATESKQTRLHSVCPANVVSRRYAMSRLHQNDNAYASSRACLLRKSSFNVWITTQVSGPPCIPRSHACGASARIRRIAKPYSKRRWYWKACSPCHMNRLLRLGRES